MDLKVPGSPLYPSAAPGSPPALPSSPFRLGVCEAPASWSPACVSAEPLSQRQPRSEWLETPGRNRWLLVWRFCVPGTSHVIVISEWGKTVLFLKREGMVLLIGKDTTVFRCKCHFPILMALYIQGALRKGVPPPRNLKRRTPGGGAAPDARCRPRYCLHPLV